MSAVEAARAPLTAPERSLSGWGRVSPSRSLVLRPRDPEDVAEALVAGVRDERFLILPHAEVARHMALKGSDPERWLKGMRRIVRNARASAG